MTKQLIIGLVGEGPTDYRFLNSIIRRTFEAIALECTSDLEILDIQNIKTAKTNFGEDMLAASITGYQEKGLSILCIHSDADAKNDKNVFKHKISPAIKRIKEFQGESCKMVVPVVPVTMTESWMIADDNLFKDEVGTNLTYQQLGLNKRSEILSNPKQNLVDAIRQVIEDNPRRKGLKLGELYLPIGQKADLNKLAQLTSYQKFTEAVRFAFKELNLIHE